MRKSLFSAILCLVAAAGLARAQQGGESKPQPTVLRPTGDVLVKALLAADSAQSPKPDSSAEDLKKLLDREIAKSAALPVATTTQTLKAEEISLEVMKTGMIVINGAVYLRFGDTIYPMVGGGASGCFDPDAEARVQKARMKFAEQVKAEQVKAGQEKKE